LRATGQVRAVTFVFSPQTQRAIHQAGDYIAAESPRAAERFVVRLTRIVRQLAAGELDGPAVRLRGRGRVQRWSLPPYRIYDRRRRDVLIVLRVCHQARRSIEVC
jgi:plasmid stabilization system protein ParE